MVCPSFQGPGDIFRDTAGMVSILARCTRDLCPVLFYIKVGAAAAVEVEAVNVPIVVYVPVEAAWQLAITLASIVIVIVVVVVFAIVVCCLWLLLLLLLSLLLLLLL